MKLITLPVTELKQALTGLSKVIARKTTLPVLQTVRLTRSPEGKVLLTGTDLHMFVTYNLEQLQEGEVLDVLLPFDQLNKCVKGSKGEVVIIPDKDKVKVQYQVGGSHLEQSVATVPVADFPIIPQITGTAVKMPANFGETLREAFETSSADSSRYVLNGAYLDIEDPKCHSIVSTNGRALFAANSFTFDLRASVNILRQKFLTWPAFLESECLIAVQVNKKSGGWVQLTTPRWNCIVKQIEGQFPKWRQVVPQDTDKWTCIRLSEAAISQMLTLSSKLPGDDVSDRTLRLNVTKELCLEGRNKDDKEYTSAVIPGVQITGKPVSTSLNREYLQSALRCGLNEIRIHSHLEPLVFSNAGKRMVIMPVRMEAATTAKPIPPAKEAKPEPQTTPKPQSEPQPRKPMPRIAKTTPPTTTSEESSFHKLLTHVDQIRDNLKNAVRDLNVVADLLKIAEKEKKTTEKEIEVIRTKLRKIQTVTI